MKVNMKKSREDREEDIISEFIKELDLSDARVKERVLMECSKQELFQTSVGHQFLKSLLPEKLKEERHKEKKMLSTRKKRRKKLIIVGSLTVILIGGIYVTSHLFRLKEGKESTMAGSESHALFTQNQFIDNLVNIDAENEDGSSPSMLILQFEELFEKTNEKHNWAKGNTYINATYMIQNSDQALLNQDELDKLSYEQLYLGLYEIYARHGRRFYDTNLQAYFNEKSWYVPLAEGTQFSEEVLNEYERLNIIAIKETMDHYESENKGAAYDYSSLTIEDMRNCLEKIYSIQKEYLYYFTITEYDGGAKDFQQCFITQKERLQNEFKLSLLDANLEEADNDTIRALFMNLTEVGYLMDGEFVQNNMGAL